MAHAKSESANVRVVNTPDTALASCIHQHVTGLLSAPASWHATLAEAATPSKTVKVLVPVMHPVEALARRLDSTDTAAQALEGWTQEADALLGAARRMRRQLVLVDARALLAGDVDVSNVPGMAGAAATQAKDVPPVPDAVLLVLAEALLARDGQASRAAAEIDTLRHGACVEVLDVARLGAAHREYAGLVSSGAGGAMAEENALMRENIVQHQAAQTAAVTEASGTKEELEALRAERDRLRETVADRHLLKAQTEAMQRRIDTQAARRRAREAVFSAVMLEDQTQMVTSQTAAEDLSDQLNAVHRSRSWRITRPLRALRSR